MFQRLKGAIDSRIAEEQAKAKAAASIPVNRTPSTRRPRAHSKVDDDGGKGPDPAEFETAFTLEDDSEPPTRINTPVPEIKEQVTSTDGFQTSAKDGSEEAAVRSSPETSADIRTKLRRLEKLDSRYQDLLRSYRIAHSRAVSIEPFEKTLKENTPLTTIREPDALVEYLNQLKTRGDMVMEELKRVTADRDVYKQRWEDAQKDNTDRNEASIPATPKPNADAVLEDKPLEETKQVLEDTGINPSIVKSPVSSILEVLSPRQKLEDQSLNNETEQANSFFSYDDEIPKLQIDLKSKSKQVGELQDKVTELEVRSAHVDKLQVELTTLQEELVLTQAKNSDLSTSVQSLEQQIQDAAGNNEANDAKLLELVDLQDRLKLTTDTVASLTAKTKIQKKVIDRLQEVEAKQKLDSMSMQSRINELIAQKNGGDSAIQVLVELQRKLAELQAEEAQRQDTISSSAQAESSAENVPSVEPGEATTKKKRNRKKKTSAVAKGITNGEPSKPVEETPKDDDSTEMRQVSDLQSQITQLKADISTRDEQIGLLHKGNDAEGGKELLTELQSQISQLRADITTRDEQIQALSKRRKTEDVLREEIENMQENFLLVGQEHVEAKETIKALQADKKSLQDNLTSLEEQLAILKSAQEHSSNALTDLETKTADLEELRIKSQSTESDLKAAQQLAASRYKDLTELRDVLQQAQPELKSLRAENQDLKSAKEDLISREAELRKLEASTKELKKDIVTYKRQAEDRDVEFRSLSDKLNQETSARIRAEDSSRIAGRDYRKLEADKIELSAANEKLSRELSKFQQEAERLRTTVRGLDMQVAKFSAESQTIKEEINLKNTQYDGAQGLLGSMRDQIGEMAMQLKETKEQSESLEEELAEVQRLLRERTRDAETMRRLLSEIDERADSKIREMKDRMEAAIQERDRSEEEASTNARRRAREVDDFKVKLKDIERDLKQATKEREELEVTDREWKRRRDELELRAEQASVEITDVNRALSELRDTLDQSEKQSREAERQKTDLRRLLDEANQRYEKLQRFVKQKDKRLDEVPTGDGSRSSVDLDGGAKRSNGVGGGMTDYVYLKTVLLQFLEQRDKKLQAQLVPVLGKLLHFDKKDEQRWVAAIVTM